ncbi:DUF4433 domain-containing protein [Desulfovibrio sp. ZJ200]|uniref:type II toxin-antitoxin system toxin DNA ADP-ribosyl transferase DarT n=1 Tax=Desulfovibrio sp. ZJ200 TaxID=2709792 RepID=UPI0013ECFFCA|nr:DUF4433 domain-containing protein [Desulfovibrio sp. ZJ200]
MPVPAQPKIYHIVHVDRLPHIIAAGYLYSDAYMHAQHGMGTTIGISVIKERRLTLPLKSHPGLHVGDCVPFYFCPRSVMLYLFSQNNHHGLTYRGGQGPIVHLEADLYATIAWATKQRKRWAFTLSNAGAYYFEDYCATDDLNAIDWKAVAARDWQGHKEAKQAEFLLEQHFPWTLVERIGVQSEAVQQQVNIALRQTDHKPPVVVLPDWYY